MAEKKGFFQRVEAEVIGAAEDYVKKKVEKKLYRVGEFSILVLLGFFLIAFGVASLIAFYFPILANGYSFILIGLLMLIIAYFMKV